MLFVAVDHHARVAFTVMHMDENASAAVQFLRDAVACYANLGMTIKRMLTDSDAPLRSAAFAQTCRTVGISHRCTRAYRPQTNGKAQRFVQSALRERAYAASTRTQPIATLRWRIGRTTTEIGTARTAASSAQLPSPGSACPGTTS